MNAVDARRRHLLLGAGLGVGALLLPWRAATAATAALTAGPYYPAARPLDHDNDLVRIAGRETQARGVVADLAGRVLDERGRPLAGVRVEIWQCDANGRYHHPRDARGAPIDEDFQGYGATTTDASGAYRFRTIRPVPYGGRTPHIHFKLGGPGVEGLTTQMFVAGEPRNADDGIYNRLDDALRESVTVAFVPVAGADVALAARFDIVLATMA